MSPRWDDACRYHDPHPRQEGSIAERAIGTGSNDDRRRGASRPPPALFAGLGHEAGQGGEWSDAG
jgi:hypothetical protein